MSECTNGEEQLLRRTPLRLVDFASFENAAVGRSFARWQFCDAASGHWIPSDSITAWGSDGSIALRRCLCRTSHDGHGWAAWWFVCRFGGRSFHPCVFPWNFSFVHAFATHGGGFGWRSGRFQTCGRRRRCVEWACLGDWGRMKRRMIMIVIVITCLNDSRQASACRSRPKRNNCSTS